MLIVLVAGPPSAGKTSFARAVQESGTGLTHVPMDSYILPPPPGYSFLAWVKTPGCVEWDRLLLHLDFLRSGRMCYAPKVDWDTGKRVSCGGDRQSAPGTRMIPGSVGVVIPGTHVFSMPTVRDSRRITVFIESPDEVIAERLAGHPVEAQDAATIIRKHLEDNPTPLREHRAVAEVVIRGTEPHSNQIAQLLAFLRKRGYDLRATVHPDLQIDD